MTPYKESIVYFAILFDPSRSALKLIFRNKSFGGWLLSSLKAREILDTPKDINWTEAFSKFIDNPEYEITELHFCKTDINQRDFVMLRPTRAQTLPNLVKQLENSGMLKNPNISYISKAKIRLHGRATHTIEFIRPNELTIKTIIHSISSFPWYFTTTKLYLFE